MTKGPGGKTGYKHVVDLASYLYGLRNKEVISAEDEAAILSLYAKLPDGDKQRINYPLITKTPSLTGQFGKGTLGKKRSPLKSPPSASAETCVR